MRQAIMRPSRSLVRAGGGSLPNVLHHRARRSSLSRDRRFSTSARISVSSAFFMRCLGFVPEGIQVYPDSLKTQEKFLAFCFLTDSARQMIRRGFLTEEDRTKLIALARDGSAAS